MKTISQILKKAKLGDTLVAGKRKWLVGGEVDKGVVVATPANKQTKFELWSSGLESLVSIPELKIMKKVVGK